MASLHRNMLKESACYSNVVNEDLGTSPRPPSTWAPLTREDLAEQDENACVRSTRARRSKGGGQDQKAEGEGDDTKGGDQKADVECGPEAGEGAAKAGGSLSSALSKAAQRNTLARGDFKRHTLRTFDSVRSGVQRLTQRLSTRERGAGQASSTPRRLLRESPYAGYTRSPRSPRYTPPSSKRHTLSSRKIRACVSANKAAAASKATPRRPEDSKRRTSTKLYSPFDFASPDAGPSRLPRARHDNQAARAQKRLELDGAHVAASVVCQSPGPQRARPQQATPKDGRDLHPNNKLAVHRGLQDLEQMAASLNICLDRSPAQSTRSKLPQLYEAALAPPPLRPQRGVVTGSSSSRSAARPRPRRHSMPPSTPTQISMATPTGCIIWSNRKERLV